MLGVHQAIFNVKSNECGRFCVTFSCVHSFFFLVAFVNDVYFILFSLSLIHIQLNWFKLSCCFAISLYLSARDLLVILARKLALGSVDYSRNTASTSYPNTPFVSQEEDKKNRFTFVVCVPKTVSFIFHFIVIITA